jgi:DNA polymerase III epsilon subunit-like protein
MKYNEFIVLDIETTGFNPAVDDAIEFAAVKLDATGKVTSRLDVLLATTQPVSPLVVSLTGIEPQALANAPTLDQAKAEIEKFCGDLPIVGHNISFDIDFLVAKGLNLPGDRLDTLELAQTALPAQPGYGLEQLAHRFNFPNQPSHRAMNDVLATVDLMLFLIGQVNSQKAATKTAVANLLRNQDWMWSWLWQEDIANFIAIKTPKDSNNSATDFLLSQITQAQSHLQTILAGVTDKQVNLLETHLPVDTQALAVVYAASHAPALLVVPGGLLRPLNWQTVGEKAGTPFRVMSPVGHQYRAGLPAQIIPNALEPTSVLIRLGIKLTLWELEWDTNPATLYLSSEEQYEWDQKFVDSKTPQEFAVEASGVWVITPEMLSRITNIADFELVSSYPHNLEEAFFDTQTRTFSIPYFNAAISSRRDFIHREVVEAYPKVADELFKILSSLGTKFTRLADLLSQIYFDHPPTSVYEKDIELIRPYCPAEFEVILRDIVSHLETYQDKLSGIGFEPTNSHIVRTQKLIDHLKALRDFETSYKYFLAGEVNKFYLQIVPSLDIFTTIQAIFSASKKVTIISAGLVFAGSFAYWKYLFKDASGKSITPSGNSSTIQLISDVNPDDNFQDVLRMVENSLARNKKILLVGGSAFDARMLFEDLHKTLPSFSQQISSLDTVGLIDKIPELLQAESGCVVVVPLYWLERGSSAVASFNSVIISKIAFEATGKPIAKLYRGDRGSFAAYTLPKTTLKLKEHLHHLSGFGGPIVLLDPRLTQKDYGQDILNALTGWQVADVALDDAIKTL